MPDPSRLRDSTQIVLPSDALDGFKSQLDENFTVTIVEQDGLYRIIGSPVEIKQASNFLVRHGISMP